MSTGDDARRGPEATGALLGRVRVALRRWRASGIGPVWVVAVSGGSDSVGLLRALHAIGPEFDLQLSVAHLDHGSRGEAAEADARFVAELAESLGLPFDLGRWRPTRAGHFEADARRARYSWLAEVAQTRGASALAAGHTRDDQAETILHRILRGTGPRGLAGMPARRRLAGAIDLVRPFLETSRSEIRAYLDAIGQGYRDDATNADLSRTRARLRHDLIPKLAAEYNPAVVEALVRLGALARGSQRTMDAWLAGRARAAIVSAGPEAIILRLGPLARLPIVARAEVVRLAWRRAGWPEGGMGADRWRRLAANAGRDRGRWSVGGGIVAEVSGGLLHLAPESAGPPADRRAPIALAVPGEVAWGGGRVLATLDPGDARDETIDLDRIEPPLEVRGPEAGDRFEPLGMEGRGMGLNDFFRGRHVPRSQRGRVPLVADRRGIVWVVGHRIAQRVGRTDATCRALGLRWEPGDCD